MNVKQSFLKKLLPILVLFVALGATWAMLVSRSSALPQLPIPIIPTVTVVSVTPQKLTLNVSSQGIVAPREEIDLVSDVSGKVLQIHPSMVSGGFFEANDLLLTIDPRDYDYAIVAAQAKVAEAKRVLMSERAQVEQAHSEWQALGQGQASDLVLRKPQLAEAQAKLQAAEADLNKAKLDRSRCELRAPFSGRVLSKKIGRGQFLQVGSVVARIFANDITEIRLPISIEELAFLNLPFSNATISNQWPNVTLHAEIGGQIQRWQGRIVRSEAAIDNSSGQLFLVAQVKNPDKVNLAHLPLFSGLFVQAEIDGVARDGLFVLPRTAVNSLHQIKLVNNEQRLEFRKVDVLRNEKDKSIIKSGLNFGERVIISEMPMPIAGMQVVAIDAHTANTP